VFYHDQIAENTLWSWLIKKQTDCNQLHCSAVRSCSWDSSHLFANVVYHIILRSWPTRCLLLQLRCLLWRLSATVTVDHPARWLEIPIYHISVPCLAWWYANFWEKQWWVFVTKSASNCYTSSSFCMHAKLNSLSWCRLVVLLLTPFTTWAYDARGLTAVPIYWCDVIG